MDNNKVILNVEDAEILRFQVSRIITNFYKDILTLSEDLAEDHDTALCKLQDNLPTEYKKYVDLADYFDEERFKRIRGKILTGGNNAIREIEEQMKNFDINIKKAK